MIRSLLFKPERISLSSAYRPTARTRPVRFSRVSEAASLPFMDARRILEVAFVFFFSVIMSVSFLFALLLCGWAFTVAALCNVCVFVMATREAAVRGGP